MTRQFSGPCLDSALQWVQNKTAMEFSGWNINVHTDLASYETDCGNSTFVGYKGKAGDGKAAEGTVIATFQGSGRASLHFGNCGGLPSRFVQVFLNDELISSASLKENSSLNFYFKPQDKLRFTAEYENTKIIIYSIQISCAGKK